MADDEFSFKENDEGGENSVSVFYGGIVIQTTSFLSVCILLCIFFGLFPSICSQNGLEITGPLEATEGENISFFVSKSGVPIQARVTFEENSTFLYSDEGTGLVTFMMPHVSLKGAWFTITASLPSAGSATHMVFVKNSTSTLEIYLESDVIGETDHFDVQIIANNKPVSDAEIWFAHQTYTTNLTGVVSLIAPDVLVTTSFGIFANKTDYQSASKTITIYEQAKGQQIMEIITPFIVQPGEENIHVRVINQSGPLVNVTISLYYEGILFSTFLSDENGSVFLSAPYVFIDNYFLLMVEKEGYQLPNDNESIMIWLLSKDSSTDLELAVGSSEIIEGTLLDITVSDSDGFTVSEATILRGNLELEQVSDSEGIVSFVSPYVYFDREFPLYAVKHGYNFAETWLTIRNSASSANLLVIDTKTSVNESEPFLVTIQDEKGDPVYQATVTFHSYQKLTNIEGIVEFTSPDVLSNTVFSLDVTKQGYQPAYSPVEVVSVSGGTSNVNISKLYLSVAPKVFEKQSFIVVVRDQNNNAVSGVQVKFMDSYKMTDHTGEVFFVAPDVSWDSTEQLRVSKTGYQSASQSLVIVSTAGFPYWIFALVGVIFVIGVFVYFRYNRNIV